MYLRKVKNKKTGRIYLSIVESYRDKNSPYPKSRTVESLGYIDELKGKYEDPIAHFTEEVKKRNSQQSKEKAMPLTIDVKERLNIGTNDRKNFGYVALSKIYHTLGIHTFLTNRQRHAKLEYNTNNIMKLLVFGRLLYPGSKKKTYENKEVFFEKTDFSLDDMYRSLSFFYKHKEALLHWIHKQITQQYQRNTNLVYYDVTNYYFEIDNPDELRRKGVSKEHRPDPIVQMGLFMDTDGIPITYGLYPGNMLDKQTFIPMLRDIQKKYSLGKTIVVADKGMTTGDNIWYTLSAKNGYVLSYSVRGANRYFKDYVLDQSGYRTLYDGFKIKSRLYPREITVTARDGRKIKKRIDEKQIVFYSEKYALKAKADRAPALEKAKNLIQHPSRYNKSTSHGAAKYVKHLTFDKKTGEIITGTKQALQLDEEKLRKEEMFDGYYAIVTSEYEMSDEEILKIYRGLWKIEESFKVTKSDLETRPIYLSKKEHIEAHFLTCFLSLVIARLLERELDGKHSITSILESLRNASCSHVQGNYYLFDYMDDILADIGNQMKIDFSKKYQTLGEIKKNLGSVKKRG